MDNQRLNQLIAIRRSIHRNPELGYQETETTNLICDELEKLHIPFQRNVAVTGAIATLKRGDGPCIALRADIDALPVKEVTGLPFASHKTITGADGKTISLMHACGHDIHTTILLGAAAELVESDFRGTVKFIFQPSEEGCYNDAEKKSGGQRIVESGALDDVSVALGLHVFPAIPTGQLAYVNGEAFGNMTFFTFKITGEAAHAGMEPEKGKDSIIVATQLIQQAQIIVSSLTPQTEGVVISFTQINGGLNHNIIAPDVTLRGTIRTLNIETYKMILRKLEELARGLEMIYQVQISMQIDLYYPSVLNDESVHSKLNPVLENVFGKENVMEVSPMLAGEDFSFYSRKVPAMFYFLGARDLSAPAYSLHHPGVVFNEDCIPLGVALMVNGTRALLRHYRTVSPAVI
jgi:amidohydrolase